MGLPSVRLKSTEPEIEGFGTMMQSMGAEQYLGKRIRARRKCSRVGWIMVRVDKRKDSVAFDNMQQRAIKGTSEWKNYQVVLDVPEDATGISFGILLSGIGSALINGGKFEVVDRSVPTTGRPTKSRLQDRRILILSSNCLVDFRRCLVPPAILDAAICLFNIAPSQFLTIQGHDRPISRLVP